MTDKDTLLKIIDMFDLLSDIAMKGVIAIIHEKIFEATVQLVSPDLRDSYINSFTVTDRGNKIIDISFSPLNQFVAIKETGIKRFSIKDKMLSSGTAKISKKGYLYKLIPVASTNEPHKSSPSMPIQLAMFRLNDVIDPKDTLTGALYGSEVFKTKRESFENSSGYNITKPIKTEKTIFRTMSNKPGSAQWIHPGTVGLNIVEKINKWKVENQKKVYESMLEHLITQLVRDEEIRKKRNMVIV